MLKLLLLLLATVALWRWFSRQRLKVGFDEQRHYTVHFLEEADPEPWTD